MNTLKLEKNMEEEKIYFNVSARTARLIGRENVANAEGAIIELIKNSYDADANFCTILFDDKYMEIPKFLTKSTFDLLEKENKTLIEAYQKKDKDYSLVIDENSNIYTELENFFRQRCAIYIFDDGVGMNDEIIKKHWMTIGTNNKEQRYRSDKRIKTGAKGIGRFALDRLGAESTMLTSPVSKGGGYIWYVNWEKFEEIGKSINEVYASLHFNPNLSINKVTKDQLDVVKDKTLTSFLDKWSSDNGTILKIQGIRDNWTETMLNALFLNLQMLIPPREEKEFRVFLYSIKNNKDFGEVEASVCDDFDYKLNAELQDNNTLKIKIDRQEFNLTNVDQKYFFNHKNIKDKPRYALDTFQKKEYEYSLNLIELLPGINEVNKNIINDIGRFSFTFYFLKQSLTRDSRAKFHHKSITASSRREWMRKFGGIRLYRDGFRVRPYGEPNSTAFDWLDLGSKAGRSTFQPSSSGWRVPPSMVAGVVHISRTTNKKFEDKSNREGIQENQVFNLFKEALKNIIRQFERDRFPIMQVFDDLYKEINEGAHRKEQADILIKKLRQSQNKKTKKIEYKSKKDLIQVISSFEQDTDTIIRAYQASKEETRGVESENKVLRALASTGLIVTAFTHELKTIKNNLDNRVDEVIEIIKEIVEEHKVDISYLKEYENPFLMLEDIKEEDLRLKQWLEFAIDAIKKDKRRRRNIELITYFERLNRNWKSILEAKQVQLNIDTGFWTEIMWRGFTIDLDSIFNNLIVNSTEAFKRVGFTSDIRNINIELKSLIKDDENIIEIIYEDSGPGLDISISNSSNIFEFNFSTKRDADGTMIGTGLGMWIVESITKEYNGDIKILKVRPSFKLKITLPLKMT